jgi:hypothetical protein
MEEAESSRNQGVIEISMGERYEAQFASGDKSKEYIIAISAEIFKNKEEEMK